MGKKVFLFQRASAGSSIWRTGRWGVFSLVTVLMDGWTNKPMEDETRHRKITIKYYLIRNTLHHAFAVQLLILHFLINKTAFTSPPFP
jgi:hypothetical protein